MEDRLVRSFGPISPLADRLEVTKREQRMAESEQEIERMQRLSSPRVRRASADERAIHRLS